MSTIKGQIIILIDTMQERKIKNTFGHCECLFVGQYLLLLQFVCSLPCSFSDAIIVSNGQRQRQTFYLLDQAWKGKEKEKLAIMLSKIAITLSREKRAEEENDDNK